MSDYSFDDSFDSGTDSDSPGTGVTDQEHLYTQDQSNPLQSKSDTQLHVPFEIHRVKEIGLSPAHGTLSDPDEAITRFVL